MAAVAQLSVRRSHSPLPDGRAPSSARNSFLSDNPRSSIVSTSAASYLTAQTAQADSSESTGRVSPLMRTVTPDSPQVNPMHNLATAQANGDKSNAVHIRRVTQDAVYLEPEAPSGQSLASKIGRAIASTVDSSAHKHTSTAVGIAASVPNGHQSDDNKGRPPSLKPTGILPNGFVAPPSPPSSESLTEEGPTHSTVLATELTEDPRDIESSSHEFSQLTPKPTPQKASKERGPPVSGMHTRFIRQPRVLNAFHM